MIQLFMVNSNTIRMVAGEISEDDESYPSALRIDFIFEEEAEATYLSKYEKTVVEDDNQFHIDSIRRLDDNFLEFVQMALPNFECFVQDHL
jgi:DNA-dependent RNA polymerase auxiliary subunit epsilon